MTEREGQEVSVTCTLTDGVLLRGPAMQQSVEDHGVWWFLVGFDTTCLSFPLKRPPLPVLPAPEDVPLSLPSPSLPSSRRSPARRRPCRGSRPRLSPARRSRRWVWTLTPCCAGWPAGRRPAWGSAAADAWGGSRARIREKGKKRSWGGFSCH